MKNYADEIANSMSAYLSNPDNFSVYKTAQALEAAEPVTNEVDLSAEEEMAPELGEPVVTAGADTGSFIKSAFASLMKASDDLDAAGFDVLAANALVLVNNLIVEAKKNVAEKERDRETVKAKTEKITEKKKLEKEKAHAKKEREKLQKKMDKEKNEARDKKMKEKAQKEKEKNAVKDKLDKQKARQEKNRNR